MDDLDLFGGEDVWGDEPAWARTGDPDSRLDGGDEDAGNIGMIAAQHVLILVDCHADMFGKVVVQEGNDDDDDSDATEADNKKGTVTTSTTTTTTPFDMALRLAQDLLQRCIRTSVTLKTGKRNGVGLLLYHTKPSRSNTTTGSDDDENEGDEDNPSKKKKSEDSDDDEDDSSVDDDDTHATTVHVLLPLAPPGVNQVKTIRRCVASSSPNNTDNDNDDKRNLEQEFACPDDQDVGRIAPLQTALEESMRIFRKAKCVKETKESAASSSSELQQYAVDSKSIWILTNRDDPYPTIGQLIQNVARDAREENIQLQVWPLPSTTTNSNSVDESFKQFNHAAFFDDITLRPPIFPERFGSLEEILDGLDDLREDYQKVRRAFYGPLLLPDWRERRRKGQKQQTAGSQEVNEDEDDDANIMIDWFRFVQLAKKPSTVTIDQETKRETIRVRQLVDDKGEIFASFKPQGTTEEKSKPQPGLKRLRHYAKFGGELVGMTKEDLAELRYQANGGRDEAGLTLLGFRPIDSIPYTHTMGPAYLIYPNDDLVKGSRAAFQALHASMLRKQVLALGEVLFRIQWSSKLVAIYPLEEELEDGQQKRPPGMMVVTLPFEDDMRELEPDAATRELLVAADLGGVKEEQDGARPEEVPSLDMDEDADGIVTGNVASKELVDAAVDLIGRQRLQGMTIGEDFTNAALDDFFNYLEAVALELPAASEPAEYDTRPDDDVILGVVRDQMEAFLQRLPEDVVAKPKRAVRKRKVVADDTGIDWEELYRSDNLSSCKVDQLKSFLRSRGESATGKKAVLVQAVEECLRTDLEKRTGKGKVKMED